MNLLLCVDDTDDLTKTTSTGAIVQEIAEKLQTLGGRLQEGISRHQLLLCDEIAYTSHNSAMCLAMDFVTVEPARVEACARQVILQRKVAASDPGLAICWPERLQDPQRLLNFGILAKQQVMTKTQAYALAEADAGLLLQELGGDGSGVIGALAGVALRLSRCDGTLRGKVGQAWQGQILSAKQLCEQLKIACILSNQGQVIPDSADVFIERRTKITFWEGRLVTWAQQRQDGVFVLCGTHQQVEACNLSQGSDCPYFEWDNDREELRGNTAPCCLNCLFRRWLAQGYCCVKKDKN